MDMNENYSYEYRILFEDTQSKLHDGNLMKGCLFNVVPE